MLLSYPQAFGGTDLCPEHLSPCFISVFLIFPIFAQAYLDTTSLSCRDVSSGLLQPSELPSLPALTALGCHYLGMDLYSIGLEPRRTGPEVVSSLCSQYYLHLGQEGGGPPVHAFE